MRTKSRIRNLVKEIELLSGYNIFESTRRREVVEIRSLLYTVLKKFYRFTLREIQDLAAEYNYTMNHASVIHSLNSFEIYSKYSPHLLEWYHAVVQDLEEDVAAERIDFIKPKLKYLSEDDLLKLSTIVKEMYEEAIIQMSEDQEEETLQI
tara:strand:+ start:544 stop:996 length:453 start_codon:yes stop_codon:yes gene_type:complete